MMTEEKKVLIVEDDEDAGMLVSQILESNGYTPEVVTKISSARKSLSSEGVYDLLFLDYNLPDGNSFELLREFPNKREAPVIIYSAYLTDAAFEEAKSLGVLECLKKPINFKLIFATLLKHKLI